VRHILRELSFEHVLLAACTLQSFIDLDDTFGDLSQFIVGKGCQVFCLQTLVVVSARGKDAQLGDVCAQAMDKTIEYQRQQCKDDQGKPDEVLIGLQALRQIVVIGQSRAHDNAIILEISGRIEILPVEYLAMAGK